MDKALHAQVVQYATSLGINNSFVISQALRAYFSKITK
ncbi:hypothetical protein CCPUN_08460 [Cardinium endosymbiont of Culicoides punctatus]|nr:hypothetical protein CCPUN_08460 [Cardinium endosymbiont of Culicoides punctatus]